MKFLIINTDYSEFLSELYTQHPGLCNASYDEQMNKRNESLFGTADFYSANLIKLGNEAWDVHANNEFLQKKWVKEYYPDNIVLAEYKSNQNSEISHLKKISQTFPFKYLTRFSPLVTKYFDLNPSWYYSILELQIQHYQPDIIWNHDFSLADSFLKKIKTENNFLIGQIAAPIPQGINFKRYDLMISSLPNFVDYFRLLGVPSEFQKLSFEPKILSAFSNNTEKTIPISFVGSISKAHKTRTKWLEYICTELEDGIIGVWGSGIQTMSGNSPIRKVFRGAAWGKDMYSILKRSKITLNHHINISRDYANNMRLYEATGMGTFLITDWKKNLSDIFEPDKEVITYKTQEECVEKIRYYLENDKEREAIARAGQERTLKEHTYYNRMQELVEVINNYKKVI